MKKKKKKKKIEIKIKVKIEGAKNWRAKIGEQKIG